MPGLRVRGECVLADAKPGRQSPGSEGNRAPQEKLARTGTDENLTVSPAFRWQRSSRCGSAKAASRSPTSWTGDGGVPVGVGTQGGPSRKAPGRIHSMATGSPRASTHGLCPPVRSIRSRARSHRARLCCARRRCAHRVSSAARRPSPALSSLRQRSSVTSGRAGPIGGGGTGSSLVLRQVSAEPALPGALLDRGPESDEAA